ncbi:hypothetical protein AB6C56_21445 [Vibrio splendidus]
MEAIFNRIEQWVSGLNKEASKHIDIVKNITIKLEKHVSNTECLQENEIDTYVSDLISKYTVLAPVTVPLASSMPLIRAVRYEETEGYGYDNVSRLSYIPSESHITPKLGRLNKKGNSLFYACLGEHTNSIDTMLLECRAEDGEIFNVLHCVTDTECSKTVHRFPPALYLVPIGINDYFRRDSLDPFGVNQDYRDMYDFIHSIALPEISRALHICDEFLTSILAQPESGNLYEITSVIAEKCLQSEQIDGVLYPSTQSSAHPNVAIKTKSVDRKLIYGRASSICVFKNAPNGSYHIENLGRGVIYSDRIEWR